MKNQKLFLIKIEKLAKEQILIKAKLDTVLSSIPNIPCEDVPEGKDENYNIEILKKGIIPKFDFQIKSHYELGEKLDMLDFDLATKTSGSRFVFVKGKLGIIGKSYF